MPIVSGLSARGLGWGAGNIPPAPILSLTSRSDTQIIYTVTNYDSVAGINAYNVIGTNASKSLSGSSLLITQSSLSAETSYNLSITVTKNGFTSATNVSNFTAPATPSLTLSSRTTTSISWQISPYNSASPATYSFTGAGSFGTINSSGIVIQSGLSAGASYAISATATKNSVTSSIGNSASRWTVPLQPTFNLTSSINSITVDITNYSSSYTYQYGVNTTPPNTTASGDPFTISGLSSSTSYTIYVHATVDGATSSVGSGSISTTKDPNLTVEYLVVAGGGGGGGALSTPSLYAVGGGGGGGGYLASSTTITINTSYPIVVGAAGGAGPGGVTGSNGSPSRFSTIVTTGGGGGGGGNASSATSSSGQPGGSGGGGGVHSPTTRPGGTGTSGQGFNGGVGGVQAPSPTPNMYSGGGGGGAGGIGGNGTVIQVVTPGGPGATWPIDSTAYARGGASYRIGSSGIAPTPANSGNGGSGGGGTLAQSNPGYAGAPGVVKFRIPNAYTASFTPGVIVSSTPSGSNNIYSITAAGPTDTVTFS